MFKNSLNIVPKLGLLFTKNCHVHNHKTRQNRSLHHHISKDEAIYITFSFHAIRIWNHISVNIKIGTSVAQFKNKSLEYLKCHDISYRIAHCPVCMWLYFM